jgi:hypothetical protein
MSPKHHSKTLSFFLPVLLSVVLLVGCNLSGNTPPTPTSIPSSTPTSTPQPPLDTATTIPPSPTLLPTTTPVLAPVNIVFTTGTTAGVVTGTLKPGQSKSYTVSAGQNQPMILILDSPNNDLYLGVTEPDGTKLLDPAKKWSRLQWLLPKTETYTVQVFGGATTENFTLTAKVAQLVNFASGSSTVTLTGKTVNGYVVSYAIYCNASQTMTMTLNVPSSTAYLDVFGLATGLLLNSSVKANTWTGVLPSTQNYVIEVIPNNGQVVNYSLTVNCH